MKNQIKKIITLTAFTVLAFLLCGCSTLSYVGEDYASNNTETVRTNEDFLFNTYKKTINNANIKMGISKTAVPEILTLYVRVENLSQETPYTFKVEDLHVKSPEKAIQFITSNNYLSIWQTQEASSMSAMGNMTSTITNMTGMNSNYNDYNQSMVQNAAEQTNKSAFTYLETNGNKILKHSIKTATTISPRKSQYFYFFFEDPGSFPITVNYKNLTYQFKL